MRVVRYLLISAARFAAGVIGFFVLLLAIAAAGCLLAVGLTCAMFTLWAVIHLTIYLTMHDRQAGHHALQAILWAAGCFAVLVVLFSIVGDLFRAARAGGSRSPR